MYPGTRQSQESYWLNQVESSTSLEGSGLTLAKGVTQEASFKTRIRPGPKQTKHKQHDRRASPHRLY